VIGWAYVRFGGLPWMQAAFYGVGAVVIGIIAISAYKLTTKNIGRDKLLWAIYLLTAAFTVWTESESIWLFLGGGMLVWLVRTPPKRWPGKSAATRACCSWTASRTGQRAREQPRLVPAGPTWRVLRESGCLRLRKRIGDRAVPLWRRRSRSGNSSMRLPWR
jgi:hypothetical protein